MRIATLLVALLALGACARAPEPYDEDVAYCRRAAQPPTTFAGSASYFLNSGAMHPNDPELLTGMQDHTFRACMRARFMERFPGAPYPLDPPEPSAGGSGEPAP